MDDLSDTGAILDAEVKQTLDRVDDGKVIIKHEQDVSAILEANKRMRDDASPVGMGRFKTNKAGMNFTLAMRVPLVVAIEIKQKYGLDMFGRTTPEERQRIYRIIQTDYPYCMTVPGRVFGSK